MKRNIWKIFIVASIITVLGLIMDGDPKEPSMGMRFLEFFALLTTIFVSVSIVYFLTTFALKSIKTKT